MAQSATRKLMLAEKSKQSKSDSNCVWVDQSLWLWIKKNSRFSVNAPQEVNIFPVLIKVRSCRRNAQLSLIASF